MKEGSAAVREVPRFPNAEWFEALKEAAAADRELAVTGRWCTLDLALIVDEERILLRLERGQVHDVIFEPDIGAAWSITLRGSLHDWTTFLRPIPPPFYTDLLAMNSRVPTFDVEGDRKVFVRHLRPLGRIFEVARQMGDGLA